MCTHIHIYNVYECGCVQYNMCVHTRTYEPLKICITSTKKQKLISSIGYYTFFNFFMQCKNAVKNYKLPCIRGGLHLFLRLTTVFIVNRTFALI